VDVCEKTRCFKQLSAFQRRFVYSHMSSQGGSLVEQHNNKFTLALFNKLSQRAGRSNRHIGLISLSKCEFVMQQTTEHARLQGHAGRPWFHKH
jgi:hypothetical protein